MGSWDSVTSLEIMVRWNSGASADEPSGVWLMIEVAAGWMSIGTW